jgi:hypothetical protein
MRVLIICCSMRCTQASIINDLLDFETLKGATAPSTTTRFDVDAAVHSVVRMFNNTVTSKVTRPDSQYLQA